MARKRKKSKSAVKPRDAAPSAESDASSKAEKSKKKTVSKKKSRAGGSKKSSTKHAKKKPKARSAAEKHSPDAADTTRAEEPEPTTVLDLDLGEDDIEDDQAINLLLVEAAALDDQASAEPEIVDIGPPDEDEVHVENLDADPDDGLDDADARDRLIAEALAFVEAPGDVAAEAHATDDSDPADKSGSDSVTDATADNAQETPAELDDPVPPKEVPLKISPDALAALTQLHKEGLTSRLVDDVLDLGSSGTTEDRDRLLAAALAYSEMQEARYRVPTETRRVRQWKGRLSSLIFLIAIIVAASPPGFVVPDPPRDLTEADRLYGLRVTLLLQSQQVDAYRAREQRLPDSLADVAARLSGVRYVRSGNRLYQLVAYTTAGEAVIYDSSAPAHEFAAVSQSWVTTRAGS